MPGRCARARRATRRSAGRSSSRRRRWSRSRGSPAPRSRRIVSGSHRPWLKHGITIVTSGWAPGERSVKLIGGSGAAASSLDCRRVLGPLASPLAGGGARRVRHRSARTGPRAGRPSRAARSRPARAHEQSHRCCGDGPGSPRSAESAVDVRVDVIARVDQAACGVAHHLHVGGQRRHNARDAHCHGVEKHHRYALEHARHQHHVATPVATTGRSSVGGCSRTVPSSPSSEIRCLIACSRSPSPTAWIRTSGCRLRSRAATSIINSGSFCGTQRAEVQHVQGIGLERHRDGPVRVELVLGVDPRVDHLDVHGEDAVLLEDRRRGDATTPTRRRPGSRSAS